MQTQEQQTLIAILDQALKYAAQVQAKIEALKDNDTPDWADIGTAAHVERKLIQLNEFLK